jgi:hypothetical protein
MNMLEKVDRKAQANIRTAKRSRYPCDRDMQYAGTRLLVLSFT